MKAKKNTKKNTVIDKPSKVVFVIMPFRETPSRNAEQLTGFFQNHIKSPIEKSRFDHEYVVRRSDDTFNITEQIIKDLYAADIVICDLSGHNANPNVMYELGMRMAFSNNPVILIREAHKDNRPIFDIAGFYAESYDPFNYTSLTTYLKSKIRKLELGQEKYISPILKVLGEEVPLLARTSRNRASELLEVIAASLNGTLRLFAGAVVSYVTAHTKLKFSNNTDDFIRDLEAHKVALNKLDWKGFVFHLGSQPTIEYYLASPFLGGLVDREIETMFTASIINYHSHFLAGDVFWQGHTSGSIYGFAGETSILRLMAMILRAVLKTTDEAKLQKMRQDFLSAYENRQMK